MWAPGSSASCLPDVLPDPVNKSAKTVNGAYRHRYAPFLMPTYHAAGCSPLALPLGELSPQVTERVLPPFLNNKINLCAHTVCPLRPRRARPPLPQGEARDTHTVHRKVHRSARFICPSAAITALERSSGKHRMAAGTETVLRPPRRPSHRELLLFVQQAHMNHGPVQAPPAGAR